MARPSLLLPISAAALLLSFGRAAFGQAAAPAPATEAGARVPQTAVCAVCGVREKAGPEPVAATYVYQGKAYYFCKQACKEEFRLDPEKWIKAAAAAPAPGSPTAPPSKPGAAAVPT